LVTAIAKATASTARYSPAARIRRGLVVGLAAVVVALCATAAALAADFLQPGTSPEQSQAGPAGAAVGDVDNDGDPDLVVSALFSTVASTLLNNGAGDFTQVPIGSNAATIDAGLGNFDADSNLDLVLLYPQTPPAAGVLAMFKGNGNGTFTFVSFSALVFTGVRPTQLWVEDFNGDGTDDVAVVNSQNVPATTNGTVMIFLGNPANNDTFAQATPNFTITVQLGATDVVGANFDGGPRDLLVSNYQSNTVSLLSGLGTGNFTVTHIGTTVSPFYMDTGDLNGDGHTDVAATVRESSPTSVRTLFGDGAGGFPTQTTVTAATAATGTRPQQLVARNFDTDADIDLAIANGVPNTVSVLDNDGTGTFTIAPTSPETVTAAGTVPFGIVGADFDGDTFDDLAVTVVFTAPGQVAILLNQTEPSADLSVDKRDTGSDPVTAGDDITYTLVVTNAGPSPASNVHVTDTLPAGLTFESSPDGCTESGGTVDCNFGAVASGATETQTFVVATSAAAVPSVTNTASVDGDEADPDPSDNSDSETTTVNAPSGGGGQPAPVPPAPAPPVPAAPSPSDPDPADKSDAETTTVAQPVTCMGVRATRIGSAAPDLLVGTPGRDVIVGLVGNDVVRGLAGNDLICGGAGRDRVLGGPGKDLLLGGLGKDRLSGGRGNDTLHGGRGDDRHFGGEGRDLLLGRRGADLLFGGALRDRLHGGGGRDLLSGGAGDDALAGGAGRDRLLGGRGNDTLNGGIGRDTLNGGPGRNRLIPGPASTAP
jgi:uncharacterized repeat protein (TIGR01451 family)